MTCTLACTVVEQQTQFTLWPILSLPMKDLNGHVTVAGFYEDVEELSSQDGSNIAKEIKFEFDTVDKLDVQG